MITLEDLLRSMQNQALTVLTSWQQGSIEAFQSWMTAMAPLMPDLNFYHELPTFAQDALGNPEAIVESAYGFAIRILELQKEFVLEIFRASMIAPRTPFVAQPDAAGGVSSSRLI